MKLPEKSIGFSLILQVFKGQTVIRGGPSRTIWRFLFDLPEDEKHPVTCFVLNDNPIEEDSTTASRVPCPDEGALERGKPNEDRSYLKPKPGSFWNDSKATPSACRLLTAGKATFFAINGFWKFTLDSKRLKGLFTISQQDSSNLWTWRRSAGPGQKNSGRE